MNDEMEPFAAAVTNAWRRGWHLGLTEGAIGGFVVGLVAAGFVAWALA